MINIFDNFFPEETAVSVNEYCKKSLYKYGEVDKTGSPPVGMICKLFETDEFYNYFNDTIKEKVDLARKLNLYRMYINCFSPGEKPYFHVDNCSGITCLYYTNLTWNEDDGGETQFLINGEIYGILPIPNRLVCFDATLLHKATSFRNDYRFTIAAKYE